MEAFDDFRPCGDARGLARFVLKSSAQSDTPFVVPKPCTLGSLRASASPATGPTWPPRLQGSILRPQGSAGQRGSSCRAAFWQGSLENGVAPRPAAASTVSPHTSRRAALCPGFHDSVPPTPPKHRGTAGDYGRWPQEVEAAAGVGARGLVPRGTFFDWHVQHPAEPRRSGMYQFCVVGIDVSTPGQPRYYAWEPTGHFDRTFSFDELDKRLALERFGRTVSLTPRATAERHRSHRKDSAGAGAVVRWPDGAQVGGLIHSRCLPDLDERGRPILPLRSGFVPRNSKDLLDPLLLGWKRRFPRPPARLLVLDGTGRAAKHVQEEFPLTEVVAIDDRPQFEKATLKLFRDRCHFPVDDTKLDRRRPAIHFPDGAFDTVLLPFVFHRLSGGHEERFLALLREALRVAGEYVLLAEDVAAPGAGDGALRRWKALLEGEWSVRVLLDGELKGGPVADHFLSQSGAQGTRRFLILRATPPWPPPP